MKQLLLLFTLCFLSISTVGCQNIDPEEGYTSASLYRSDIETVHVPIFESDTLDQGIEFEITRALCLQLELHSPYKVVSDPDKADTILYGRITSVSEKVLTQQRQLDRPMENQVVLTVNVTWKTTGREELLLDNRLFRYSGYYPRLLPAGRESAVQQAVNKLAQRIVESMEETW